MYTGTTTSYKSSLSGTLDESLAQSSTTTAVSVSTGSTTYGQPVTFTATVTPEAGSSTNPTGSVTFVNNATEPATDLGSATVSTTAGTTTAHLALPYLPAGSYSVQATYGGDSDFTGSTSSPATPATVTVGQVTAGVESHELGRPVGRGAVGDAHRHHHPSRRSGADRHRPVLRQRGGHRAGRDGVGRRRHA